MNATDYTAQAQAWADTYGVRMTATDTGSFSMRTWRGNAEMLAAAQEIA